MTGRSVPRALAAVEPPPDSAPALPSLTDVRVLELGVWVAAPGACGILADWGADVVKVEPPIGDPARAVFRSIGSNVDESPPFMVDNRGKRSVVLDLDLDADRAQFDELLAAADIFVTNLRISAIERLGLSPESVRAAHPRLIYARVTAFGAAGAQRGRPSYDLGAFWARSGLSHQLAPTGAPPLNVRSAIGDHVTSLALVGGIMGALFERASSGQGQLVEVSLQGVGAYVAAWDLSIESVLGRVAPGEARDVISAPLMNSYRTADDRWLFLTALEVQRHFELLCAVLGCPELPDDPRFADPRSLRKNSRALIEIFDKVFVGSTLAEWAERLDAAGVWWEPVQTPAEVLRDAQLAENNGFVDVPTATGVARLVNSPVTFNGRAGRGSPSPDLGEHTTQILSALPHAVPAKNEPAD